MQLFRSEEDIDEWSTHTGIPVGARFPPEQLWELATRWYDDRFDLDWGRRTVEERQAILDEVGLIGAFWHLR
ncbi:MAG: hypothetical protein HKN74_00145 [Acidimicrobiia bacterium]|nr:alkylmercury lyase family protein [Acidimicrobiia bacterium]MBT8217257.1 alkylmercury lyase family protein [Acidimicrobiia bacterium]NNF08680.1 hypothetical protein [Acidimicrobiia bacterium]NNL70620.1 hypothetical protein [Acidimicrobiia bacterium]